MPVPVEAKDLASGDYSIVNGTITSVIAHRDPKSGELETLDIVWASGVEQLGVKPDTLYEVAQGWGTHESSVRLGLAADHAND